MKILIISDIHAMSKDLLDLTESTQPKPQLKAVGGYSGTTRGLVMVEEMSVRQNRLLAVPKFLKENKLDDEIDYMICLGDMAHQCKKSVLQIIWQQLNNIASDLNISKLLAVSGNHDVAAHKVDFENGLPNSMLNHLKPLFPVKDKKQHTEYHSEKFTIIEDGDIGLVLIDTSSLLGYGGANKSDLWNKGFISDDMIDKIETRMKKSACSAFIVSMHHHPISVHQEQDIETDYIENGADFLSALQKMDKPSFVIHGHKHFVNFQKYNDKANSPWILSAASLAARPYPKMEENYKCQFHILDINLDNATKSLSGQIRSWDWVANQWDKAGSSGMTHLIGFGRKASITEIANKIYEEVKDGGSLTGRAAFETVPELKFLTQNDLHDLQAYLKNTHSVETIPKNGVEKFAFYVEEDDV